MTGDADMDAMLERCFKILKVKGDDYTMGNKADRLHNFRTVASFTGLDMGAVWAVYFYKHVSAIFAFIKGVGESEPIEERIADAINYLLLLSRLVAERKAKTK
jgi:hypothetical protein